MIVASKDIIVLETKLNDDVIAQLKSISNDEVADDIKLVIKAYTMELEEKYPNVELFEIGSHYIVTEDCIYIAVYADEIENIEKISTP